jgi:coproporphyrinogen III oxidase-like Fe-S oxidoreductase
MTDFQYGDTPQEVSTSELKELIKSMNEQYDEYERLKTISNKAKERADELEKKVVDTLRAAGLKRFDVPGVGTCTVATKFSVRIPKDLENKRKLFEYIGERHGPNVLDEFRTINYQTLNAWFNKEAEANDKDKKDFSVPGLEAPSEDNYLQFRSDKTTKT